MKNVTSDKPPEPASSQQRTGFLRDRIAKRKHDQSTTSKRPVSSSQDVLEDTVKENDEEPADELSMLVKDDSSGIIIYIKNRCYLCVKKTFTQKTMDCFGKAIC